MRVQQTVFDEQELILRANGMVRKATSRRMTRTLAYLSSSPEKAITIGDAAATAPKIHKCKLIQEGHFTHIMLNDSVSAFAKFNPNDIKYVQLPRRQGSRRGTIGNKVAITKFSNEAGVDLAIHRAVTKLLEPFSR